MGFAAECSFSSEIRMPKKPNREHSFPYADSRRGCAVTKSSIYRDVVEAADETTDRKSRGKSRGSLGEVSGEISMNRYERLVVSN